jgi:hypothetical protein
VTNEANQQVLDAKEKLHLIEPSRLTLVIYKLELPKCFYCILAWKFDSKGNPLPVTKLEQWTMAKQITIPDSTTNTPITISKKEVFTGHKTLGCYKSIIGNEHDKIQYLKPISNNLRNNIKNTH